MRSFLVPKNELVFGARKWPALEVAHSRSLQALGWNTKACLTPLSSMEWSYSDGNNTDATSIMRPVPNDGSVKVLNGREINLEDPHTEKQ